MTSGSTFGLVVSGTAATRMVRVTGRLVSGAGAEHSGWAAVGALAEVDGVCLDLSGVAALDAGGLGRLLVVRRALAARGIRLILTAASPRVRRVLALTGLAGAFAAPAGAASFCRCA